jgi:hypothetical protein
MEIYVVFGDDDAVDEEETVGCTVWGCKVRPGRVVALGVVEGVALGVVELVEQPDTAPITHKAMINTVIALQPILACALWLLYFDLCQCGLHMKHLSSVSKKSLYISCTRSMSRQQRVAKPLYAPAKQVPLS